MGLKSATEAAEERRAAGPYAFPTGNQSHEGMTLRDWFAGRAMQGLIDKLAEHLAEDVDAQRIADGLRNTARLSYSIADAMLRERDRK